MNIRALVAKLAGEASGAVVPISGPAAEAVMTELLGVQDEQLEILRELKSTIGRLLDVPWKSARIYMEEAAIPSRSPEQVRQSLEHAAEKLHEAMPRPLSSSAHVPARSRPRCTAPPGQQLVANRRPRGSAAWTGRRKTRPGPGTCSPTCCPSASGS